MRTSHRTSVSFVNKTEQLTQHSWLMFTLAKGYSQCTSGRGILKMERNHLITLLLTECIDMNPCKVCPVPDYHYNMEFTSVYWLKVFYNFKVWSLINIWSTIYYVKWRKPLRCDSSIFIVSVAFGELKLIATPTTTTQHKNGIFENET